MSDDFTAAEGCHDMKDIPPWPHSVIGAEVLNEIAGTFTSKLAPVPHAADAFSLYVLFTHCAEVAEYMPRLLLSSPTEGCGKSIALDLFQRLCRRGMGSGSITKASFVRDVHHFQPCLIFDEGDTSIKGSRASRSRPASHRSSTRRNPQASRQHSEAASDCLAFESADRLRRGGLRDIHRAPTVGKYAVDHVAVVDQAAAKRMKRVLHFAFRL